MITKLTAGKVILLTFMFFLVPERPAEGNKLLTNEMGEI